MEPAGVDAHVTALVGRRAELDALLSDYGSVAAGSAWMIVVDGPLGIGKSALLDVFAARVAEAGATVLRGSCARVNLSVGYDAVERLFGFAQSSSVDDSVSLSQRLYRAVLARVVLRPLVLLLDDAQWCDEPSLMWLELLLRRGRELPVLVVLAQRSSQLPPWRHSVHGANAGRHRTITLARLADEDAAVLAAGWCEPEGRGAIASAGNTVCGGNPALLERLFARLYDEGSRDAVRATEIGAELFANRLRAVLDGHPPYVRGVAEAVALLGRTDPELVSMLSGVSERMVAAVLAVLWDEGILDGARFPSERARSVVLDLPSRELAERRTLAARLLNDAGAELTEISAQLLLLPALTERWMRELLRETARRAERDGDLGAAARLLDRLLTADPGNLALRVDLARVLGPVDPGAAHATVTSVPGTAADARGRARLVAQLTNSVVLFREVPATVDTLARVATELRVIGDRRDHELRMLVDSALLAIGCGSAATLPIVRSRASMTPEPAGHTPAERAVLAVRATLSMLDGSAREAALAQARGALGGEELPVSWVFVGAVSVLALAGESDEAMRAADRVIAACGHRGMALPHALALAVRSWLHAGAGDLAAARSDATLAVAAAEESLVGEVALPRATLATVLIQQGELTSAAALLDRAERCGAVLVDPHLLMARSALCRITGDREGALRYAFRCRRRLAQTRILNPVFAPWWVEAAELLVRLERREEAQEVVEYGEELAGKWGSAAARGLALMARGVVLGAAGGTELLSAAAETLAETPAHSYRVRSELALGDALLRRADKQGARRHFRRAVDLAVRGGFWVLSETARKRLQAAGGRRYQSPVDPSDVLTSGERRVAELVAKGATNREIADTLTVALRTVEIHLTSIYRKLRVSGRAGLRSALARAEIIGGPL